MVGTVLTAAGLYILYKAHTFPRFSSFPEGSAPRDGNFFFGVFGANGWTGLFTAVVGGVLLFGAAEHRLAKAFSLICGAALGAAAVIALISGNVLGMAAANGWTKLGWGACAVILLANTLSPRRRREVAVANATAMGPVATPAEGPVATDSVAAPAEGPAAAGGPSVREEPAAVEHPTTAEGAATGEPAAPGPPEGPSAG